MIWFGWVLWHINHFRLFNAKSSLYIYIKYIWFGLVGFYGISTIVGYLIPNLLYTYILNIYDLVWFGFMAYQPFWVIWCQSSLHTHTHTHIYIYIYIYKIWLIGFYGISTIVGYLMPNPLYTYIYILNIYNLVWLVFMGINHFRSLDAKSSLYIYIRFGWLYFMAYYPLHVI